MIAVNDINKYELHFRQFMLISTHIGSLTKPSPIACRHMDPPIIYLQLGVSLGYQGRPQDLGRGGGQNFFFRFGNLHVAKRHAAHGEAIRIARGVWGHAPPRKYFKTVQFGAF